MSEKPTPGDHGSSSNSSNTRPKLASSTETIAKPHRLSAAFRALGIPSLPRPRLPSRNWLIFLSITSSFTTAYLYDRREARRAREKWCSLVSRISPEPLAPTRLPRKISIYIAAPPGDWLGPAREEFYEWVKPVLVSAALDWQVIEGRKEGDIRYGVAEAIRKHRMSTEEGPDSSLNDSESEQLLRQMRQNSGTREYDGVKGDLIMGRHTWKEYIRGLHEGWLGPIRNPVADIDPKSAKRAQGSTNSDQTPESLENVIAKAETDVESEKIDETTNTEGDSQDKSGTKAPKPLPYISTPDYTTASLPPSIPEYFQPVTILPFPHLMGFLGTPVRLWRFLNQRYLADELGQRTAEMVLAESLREFKKVSRTESDENLGELTSPSTNEQIIWEQSNLLQNEEKEWHKSVRKREKIVGKEDLWKDEMIFDDRLANRMRKFTSAQ